MRPDALSLDIVIVDYRAGALLRDCLESLGAHPPEHVRLGTVIVVDNAPGGPPDAHRSPPGLSVTVVPNSVNRGFAAACNQGAAIGRAPYVLFLNPDTRVQNGSLDIPVRLLERTAEEYTGIVGVQLVGKTGIPGTTCYRFPKASHFLWKAIGIDRLAPERFSSGVYSDFRHDTTRQVDQVMGAFFMVRRSVFERLGGFDERFFVYFEEMDFSKRAMDLGFRSLFIAEARAYHAGCGTTEMIRARRLFYSLRSRLKYADKHFSVTARALTWTVTFLLEPLSRLGMTLGRGRVSEARETLKSYLMLATWLIGFRDAE